MSYATVNDLYNAGLNDEILDQASDDQKERCLLDAANLIDSYLASKFTVPLTDIPAIIITCTVEIAQWKILETIGFNPDSEYDLLYRQRYQDWLAWLNGVATGRVNIRSGTATSQAVPQIRSEASFWGS